MPRDRLFGGERSMKFGKLTRHLGLAVVAVFVVAACGSSPSNSSASCSESTAKTATSASSCGGIDALVAAAKAEGKLNVIALPRDWANYGAILDGFHAKYVITITSDNPTGSSQDEVDAVKNLKTSNRAPDVLDVGQAVAIATTSLYAPYMVQPWDDILTSPPCMARTSRRGRSSCRTTRSSEVSITRRSTRTHRIPRPPDCLRNTSTPARARTCGSRASLGRCAWLPCSRAARSTRPRPP